MRASTLILKSLGLLLTKVYWVNRSQFVHCELHNQFSGLVLYFPYFSLFLCVSITVAGIKLSPPYHEVLMTTC